jgi:hypothetical protein
MIKTIFFGSIYKPIYRGGKNGIRTGEFISESNSEPADQLDIIPCPFSRVGMWTKVDEGAAEGLVFDFGAGDVPARPRLFSVSERRIGLVEAVV